MWPGPRRPVCVIGHCRGVARPGFTKLNYRYPYHQAVGLYLKRAGAYKASQLQLMRKFQLATLDFYLAHELVNPAYDAQWRVYYPAHF